MPSSASMRLIALPLTKQVGNLTPLIYYYPHTQHTTQSSSTTGTQGGLTARARALFHRALGTATTTWVGFGRAEPRSWKYRLYSAGQSIHRRIDFEELALSSLEPALGPSLGRDRRGEREEALRAARARGEARTISLLYPSFLPSPTEHLRSLVSHRAPVHRRWTFIYLIFLPITAPFALVPVIPNIPFFYCAWRAWGHYRSWRAASYLEELVRAHMVVETPSPLLDKLYAGFPSPPASSSSLSPAPTALIASTSPSPASETHSPKHPPKPSSKETDPDPIAPYLLLTEPDVLSLLKAFSLPEEGRVELGIALAQARARVGEELRGGKKEEGKKER
ncbi:hypothetical protein DACRYDRAFT_110501 [Dacryopinax primogenitus]|uniref:Mitochondrial K+-H+ exchange-related-domain-containing protein n=1 Tax=Dacryopinax primogenitus (strain DJM 731) TaxID=1858805 RepID=M5G4C2_DACPD|nr:uncharacterized protein DACRYDRAFT_110501 [Dacryopinax primogenitus]EJT98592.1 hypothetical protein DACRYDRAFT_110501 [Dacryopinax primogenitus]